MADNLLQYMQQLEQTGAAPFALSELPGFPEAEYNRLIGKYTESESWYNGSILDTEVVTSDAQRVNLYPVRVNPIVGAVAKHAYSLFGETAQDDRPLVYPRVLGKDKELAFQTEDVLNQVWYESGGRSMQMQNAILSQIYGGCVFRINFDPIDKLRSVPIRIDAIHPKCFIGIPYSNDFWKLREAWIVRPISPQEAKDLSVNIDDTPYGWLVEHWTPKTLEITINSVPVRVVMGTDTVPIPKGNPFGFIPIVYIPHIRSTGFYGDNLIDNVRGIVKEMNLRLADYGDAISVDSHSYVGMRNVPGSPTVQQVAPGVWAINLGTNPSIGSTENKPDIFDIRKPSASAPMQNLVSTLYDQFRRDAYIPSVADGEDEGSQRSGLTLAMRMWPLISHTNMERTYWTVGLDILNRMIIKMLVNRKFEGVTEEMTKLRIKEYWSPVLPRDREMIVNEVVQRVGANLGSPEHLIGLLGDVDDVEEEIKLILEFKEKLAELQLKSQPPPVTGTKKASSGTPAKTDVAEEK